MPTTFTNGYVTLADDLVFGVVVLAEHGWHPVSELSSQDVRNVIRLLDNNPTCPQRFIDALRKQLSNGDRCPYCGLRGDDVCENVHPRCSKTSSAAIWGDLMGVAKVGTTRPLALEVVRVGPRPMGRADIARQGAMPVIQA